MLFGPPIEELKSNFYTKSSTDDKNIELIENCEITNEFKQNVCLPYFKDLYKVKFFII